MELEYIGVYDLIQKTQIININEVKRPFDSLEIYLVNQDKKFYWEKNIEFAFLIYFIFLLFGFSSKFEGLKQKTKTIDVDFISQKVYLNNQKKIQNILYELLLQNSLDLEIQINNEKNQVFIYIPFKNIVRNCDLKIYNVLIDLNDKIFLTLRLDINEKISNECMKNIFLLWL